MLQEHDFSKPDVMGCDGPVGTYKRSDRR
jgi:hypothetical protein